MALNFIKTYGYGSSIPMTVGTTYTSQDAIMISATAAGAVVLQLPDGTQCTVQAQIGSTIYPLQVTKVVSSAATATFYNLY